MNFIDLEQLQYLPPYAALALVVIVLFVSVRQMLPYGVKILDTQLARLKQDAARDQQEFDQRERLADRMMRQLELSEQTVASALKSAEAGQKNAEMAQKTLEEQALVFKRDRKLQEEQMANAVGEIERLTAQAASQEKKIDRLEINNAELVKANAEIEAAMRDLTTKYRDNQQTLTVQAQTLAKQAEKIEELEVEGKEKDAIIQRQDTRIAALETENKDLTQKVKKLSDKTDGLENGGKVAA